LLQTNYIALFTNVFAGLLVLNHLPSF